MSRKEWQPSPFPLGPKIHVRRHDGAVDTYIFRGTDSGGPIYVDSKGIVRRDFGVYISITVDSPEISIEPNLTNIETLPV